MLVQWEDEEGNLYEAGFFGDYSPHGYIKVWDPAGRKSATRGTHRVIWQGGGPGVAASSFPDTVREMAETYGCPHEKAIRLLEVRKR